MNSAIAYYIDEDTGQSVEALCQVNGEEVWIYTQHNTPYVVVATSYGSDLVVEDDPRPSEPDPEPIPDPPYIPGGDDDDYVPIPPVVIDQSSSGDDETVKIVACAACAVVAAFLAAVMVFHRRD